MGTQQSKEVRPPSQWEWLENDNGVEIYRNKHDGRVAERRRVTLVGSYALSEQNKVYAFRSNNPYGLVKSYDTIEIQDPSRQKQKISDLCKCSGEKIQLDVYTERIQYRLSELPQLTFPESLLVLKQTIPAFQVAYQKVGGLHINPELIGITDKGEVRAWVNENWALNRPSHVIPILKSSSRREYFDTIRPELRDQSEMINNLISVISQKTEKGHFPQPFAEQLRARAVNFRATKKFLNEYTTIHNITLPTQIKKNKNTVGNQNATQPSFMRSNSFVTSGSVSALQPQALQTSYQPPKFSFNNASYQAKSLNKPIPVRAESSIPIYDYKPSNSIIFSNNPQPSLSFNTYSSQIPLSFNPEIKEVVSSYKPYIPQAKSEGQSYTKMFDELKFNLLRHIQPQAKNFQVKVQPMNSDIISKPESPLYKLNQLSQNQGQMTHHNASYKILSSSKNEGAA